MSQHNTTQYTTVQNMIKQYNTAHVCCGVVLCCAILCVLRYTVWSCFQQQQHYMWWDVMIWNVLCTFLLSLCFLCPSSLCLSLPSLCSLSSPTDLSLLLCFCHEFLCLCVRAYMYMCGDGEEQIVEREEREREGTRQGETETEKERQRQRQICRDKDRK